MLIAELEAWQNEPDSRSALQTLPRLTREDADIEPEWVETEVRNFAGVPVLIHELNCNGVVHMRFQP